MAESLLARIIREISGWDEEELACRLVHDGNGHSDVMGYEVTERGREALRRIIEGYDVSDR